MWVVIMVLIWKFMEWVFDGELTDGIGGLMGIIILLIVTIAYVVIFWGDDYNWIDIFKSMANSTTKIDWTVKW
jgi:hypothetical protein